MVENRQLAERLQRALARQRWSEVLAVAERLLELSPDRSAGAGRRFPPWWPAGQWRRLLRQTAPHVGKVDPVNPPPSEPRFLLWVDAVGGFLVCPGNQIVIGQPVPNAEVDVPILGDLSRRHAVIRREGEAYVVESERKVRLDGRQIERAALLTDGCQLELGDGVRLRFRRSHPLCPTARLEFLSRHRTQPPADAVLLMADACVLGPDPKSHVVCRDWTREVVLFRQSGGLAARVEGRLSIDGVEHQKIGPLDARSRVAGGDFSFSVEPA